MRVNVYLPDDIYEALKIEAVKKRTSMSALIAKMLGTRDNYEVKEKRILGPSVVFCKHGYRKDLCKFKH